MFSFFSKSPPASSLEICINTLRREFWKPIVTLSPVVLLWFCLGMLSKLREKRKNQGVDTAMFCCLFLSIALVRLSHNAEYFKQFSKQDQKLIRDNMGFFEESERIEIDNETDTWTLLSFFSKKYEESKTKIVGSPVKPCVMIVQ